MPPQPSATSIPPQDASLNPQYPPSPHRYRPNALPSSRAVDLRFRRAHGRGLLLGLGAMRAGRRGVGDVRGWHRIPRLRFAPGSA